MWEYLIAEGVLLLNGEVVGRGYSGAPGYVNNANAVAVKGKGPIPPGEWFFSRAPWSSKGPQVLSLMKGTETETYGRTAFMIHGDNKRMNRSASNGCIILPRSVRDRMASDSPGRLVVRKHAFVQSEGGSPPT